MERDETNSLAENEAEDAEDDEDDEEAESPKTKEDLEQRCVGLGEAEKTVLLLIILPPPCKARKMKHVPVK